MAVACIGNGPEQATTASVTADSVRIVTQDPYYNQAYHEILDMLEGKQPYDFKRAVFLDEWAYLRGGLDYGQYCADIARHATNLKKFIRDNGVEQYRTAGNYALFEFFTQPNFMNDGKVYSYDFEDFCGDKDYTKLFVTKLMRTHTGQCTSLPTFYKILAEEIGAGAYLALAPMHMYIKHLDENNRWVNVELTNGHLATDAHMIASMGISAESIRKGVYLDALDMQQSIAMQMEHLRHGYETLYGSDPEDPFIRLCCEKALEYFPTNLQAWLGLHNYHWDKAEAYRVKLGVRKFSPSDTLATRLVRNVLHVKERIADLGYRQIEYDQYLAWINSEEFAKGKAEQEKKTAKAINR